MEYSGCLLVCMVGRQGLAKPITWLESILITLRPINHAPNGSQSQDHGLIPLDLVHRFGRTRVVGPMGWSTKGALRGGLHGFKVHRHHPHHYLSIFSFRGQVLSVFFNNFTDLRNGGGATEEGEAKTRIRESSHRRQSDRSHASALSTFSASALAPLALGRFEVLPGSIWT